MKEKKKKAATVQMLKPKHCSYSVNWTNQIGIIATVQKKKKKKEKEKEKKINDKRD